MPDICVASPRVRMCTTYCAQSACLRTCSFSVTLVHVVGSFLSADDRVDFSCEWIEGGPELWRPYAAPIFVEQMEQRGHFIIISGTPHGSNKMETAHCVPCFYFICQLMLFS